MVRAKRVILGIIIGGVLGLLSSVAWVVILVFIWEATGIDLLALIPNPAVILIFFLFVFSGAVMGGLTQAKPNHKWFFTQIGGDDLEIDWGGGDLGVGLVFILFIVLAILPLVMLIEVIGLVRPNRSEGGVTRECQQGNSTDTDYSVNDR